MSLLSNIEKIIEKLIYKRLSNFLEISNNLIYLLQFGFQPKYNTQLIMLWLISLKVLGNL